jgi:hypothetical protein
MDIGKALSFVYDEEGWIQKVAIGVGVLIVSFLLSFALVGILGWFILTGYCLRLMRNVQDGRTQVLPEWNEWGDDLASGFKLAVVSFVWAIPGIVFGIPMILGGFLTEGNEFAQVVGLFLMLCAGALVFFYSIFVFLAMPGYTIAFAQDSKISSGLELTAVWHWTRANISSVIVIAIMVAIFSTAAAFLAGIVGTLFCVVGLIITIPLATLITAFFQYHLYGQLAREHPFDEKSPSGTTHPVVDTEPTADADVETP